MKTLLLARPDHSTFLYEGLRQNPTIDIKYHTFSVFKKGSWLNRWKPQVKSMDSEVEISYTFTFFHRLLDFLNKQITFDYYGRETQISEFFFEQILRKYQEEFDLVHYWPMYCHRAISDFQPLNPRTKLLAEVYAAHPDYVREILAPEYDKYGISIEKSHFIKSRDRDLASLEGVKNMLVPSEYIASIYQKYYPNTKIFTASYGLLNFAEKQLMPSNKRKSEILKLVFVGKISIEKGSIYLLEAMKKLPPTAFQLDLIGEIEPNQIAIFKPYFNISNISFLGKLANFKILAFLPNYHIFVLPSLSDAYSLAVSEALTQKLPVIITENVGNKVEVNTFDIGKVIQIKDSSSLIEAILFLQNEEYRQTLIQNIDNFIIYNQQNSYSAKVLNIYNYLINH
jgi:glycosyltransferase involved in cell wall biosynthesis